MIQEYKRNEFFIGCKVICMHGNSEFPCHPKLKKGEKYIVAGILNNTIYIKELNSYFNMNRFITMKKARFYKLKEVLNDAKEKRD